MRTIHWSEIGKDHYLKKVIIERRACIGHLLIIYLQMRWFKPMAVSNSFGQTRPFTIYKYISHSTMELQRGYVFSLKTPFYSSSSLGANSAGLTKVPRHDCFEQDLRGPLTGICWTLYLWQRHLAQSLQLSQYLQMLPMACTSPLPILLATKYTNDLHPRHQHDPSNRIETFINVRSGF